MFECIHIYRHIFIIAVLGGSFQHLESLWFARAFVLFERVLAYSFTGVILKGKVHLNSEEICTHPTKGQTHWAV